MNWQKELLMCCWVEACGDNAENEERNLRH